MSRNRQVWRDVLGRFCFLLAAVEVDQSISQLHFLFNHHNEMVVLNGAGVDVLGRWCAWWAGDSMLGKWED
ncbi:hypothetical protein [Burkholderia sp. 22PA0106]|uniref:hypothetical protein n=1 Tax=Burkholderia sp. 22PA0106 TaxID=3237371 RepID=UPI0039C312C8